MKPEKLIVTPLTASTFKSDGGAMFGFVPKPLWQKRIKPDELNRIPQRANVLLVEWSDGKRGLIDTGCGNPELFSTKAREISGIPDGPWPLEIALSNLGLGLMDIDLVLLSHLHWDHAGGCRLMDESCSFQNAHFFIHETEWEDALRRDPLLHKSYPDELIHTLNHTSHTLVKGTQTTVLPGLTFIQTGGHTRGHCSILLEADTIKVNGDQPFTCQKLLYAGDVCPTRHHLPLVYQTSYDTYPLQTRAWKQKWLPYCKQEGVVLAFCHDPETVFFSGYE